MVVWEGLNRFYEVSYSKDRLYVLTNRGEKAL